MTRRKTLSVPWALAVLLVSAAVSAGPRDRREPRPPSKKIAVNPKRVEAKLDSLIEHVARMRVLTEGSLGREDRRLLVRELHDAREEVLALRDLVRAAPELPVPFLTGRGGPMPGPSVTPRPRPPHVTEPAAPRPAPAPPAPMGAGDFERALASVHHHGFSDERLGAVHQLAGSHWFLVSQARQILEAFSFAKDKLDALRLVAPRIVDPGNRHLILEDFSFGADKQEAGRILDTIPAQR